MAAKKRRIIRAAAGAEQRRSGDVFAACANQRSVPETLTSQSI